MSRQLLKVLFPIFFLDKYSCHTRGRVTNRIEELGVEWDIIPAGCTGLIQPIDVGIGKPFKNRMRYRWEECDMMDQYSDEAGNVERIRSVDAQRFIAQWATDSWNIIPKMAVKNSWRHKPFSYFPEESTDRKSTRLNSSH